MDHGYTMPLPVVHPLLAEKPVGGGRGTTGGLVQQGGGMVPLSVFSPQLLPQCLPLF